MSAPRHSQISSSGRGGTSMRSRKASSRSCGKVGAAGMGPVRKPPQAALVVDGYRRLDGTAAEAQGRRSRRVPLLGQDDRLHPGPGAGVAVLPGRLLKAIQRVMVLDVHLRDIPTDPCP